MDYSKHIPIYFEPLLDGTPLALERIQLAWPELPMTDRASLVSILLATPDKQPHALEFDRHRDIVINLALSDESGYVRYLAAGHVEKPSKDTSDEDVDRYTSITEDKAMLVRAAVEEQIDRTFNSIFNSGRSPATFWEEPQVMRLASLKNEDVEYIAELLRFATTQLLPDKKVTLFEMGDLLLQYLGAGYTRVFKDKAKRAGRSYDPDLMLRLSTDVKTLWLLVPDVPKGLTYLLLDMLPEPPYSPIPPEVVAELNDYQLRRLLLREDIQAKELRRKLYMESVSESVRCAVVSTESFTLLDSDVSRLVVGPNESEETGEAKLTELLMLAELCHSASLAQMSAIWEFVFHFPMNRDISMELDRGRELQTGRAKRLSPKQLGYEVLEMRIFALASGLCPLKRGVEPDPMPKALRRLQHLVLQSNPWETYLKLRNAMPMDQWKQVAVDLPEVTIRDVELPTDY